MGIKEKLQKVLPERVNQEWEFIRGAYYERIGKGDKLPEALKKWYRSRKHRDLDLNDPKTFSEKIQWLKIYDVTPEKTRLCDKYLVREWIRERIGEEYLVPLIGAWDNAEEIDFQKLPEQFVLKTNHSSGWNIVVTNKSELDINKTKRKLDRWMNTDFATFMGYEMQYRDVKRKIIAEEYIGDGVNELDDFKVMCFHGEPRVIWIDRGRHTDHRRNLYNEHWEKLPVTMLVPNLENDPPAPATLSKMWEIAKILSKGFICARIDFFEVNGKLYFGEITFTSGSGLSDFDPPEVNREWGDLMHLPEEYEVYRY